MKRDERLNDDERNESRRNEKSDLKPDPGTLHTTDPQEEMKGPFSSTVKKLEKTFDNNESKKDANERREKNM